MPREAGSSRGRVLAVSANTTTCLACRCYSMGGATAFLAGISFAFSFSGDAMRKRLCPEHAEILVRAHKGALPAVPAGDRRDGAVPQSSEEPKP